MIRDEKIDAVAEAIIDGFWDTGPHLTTEEARRVASLAVAHATRDEAAIGAEVLRRAADELERTANRERSELQAFSNTGVGKRRRDQARGRSIAGVLGAAHTLRGLADSLTPGAAGPNDTEETP